VDQEGVPLRPNAATKVHAGLTNGRRTSRIRIAAWGTGAVSLVVLMILANGSLGGSAIPAQAPTARSGVETLGNVAATLEGGSKLADSSPTFWGVVAQTAVSRGITSDTAIGKFLNATPFVTFAYTQQSDQCNVTTNTQYQDDGSTLTPCGFDVHSFKAWCSSKGSGCVSIFTLPGENNNSGEDANIANYIVHTVGFQPTYWAIGNEPMLWKHYGIAWSSWKTTDARTPTPVAYATDLKNAIAAVKKVDTNAKFVGIEADCECSPTWFAAVGKIDGSSIAAVAYHTYPSTALLQQESATQFFAPLTSSANVTTSYATVRKALVGQCTGCGTLPIFVTEYNSGPGWVPSNYAGTYQDAVFLAGSVVQALRANVTMFDIFHLQTYQGAFDWALMNGTDAVSPAGLLFEDLLVHLDLGVVMGVTVRTTTGNVWAVTTFHGNQETLLVVNANVTQSINLNLNHVPWVKAGSTSTIYQWSPGQSKPSVTSTTSMASSYVIPAESILMLDYTT
jgi:hypothetical protein